LKHTDNKQYVVAKYTDAQAEEQADSRIPVSREAATIMQFNTAASDGILCLRNFRYFDCTNRWLYMTEYCPSDDTEVLRFTYNATGLYIVAH
jgi:hypothetical protein